MRENRRSGFTLVEIMVVVIIIGILATLVIARVVGHSDRARAETTKAMVVTVATNLELFKVNHGRFPESLDELRFAPNWVKPETYPQGGYLREEPLDSWGNKLVYRRGTQTSSKPFELFSHGADGQEGGEGYDADIAY